MRGSMYSTSQNSAVEHFPFHQHNVENTRIFLSAQTGNIVDINQRLTDMQGFIGQTPTHPA